MPKETVEAKDVLSSVGSTKVEPTFVQKAGLRLALGVGGLIAVITLIVVIFFCCECPAPPTTLEMQKAPDTKVLLEQYKELSGVCVSNAQSIFQTTVTQALLPVFTAILGYIFARSHKDSA